MVSSIQTGVFTLAGGSAETITGLTSSTGGTLLKAHKSNASDIEIGQGNFGAGTGYPLAPGEFISSDAVNIQGVRVRGAAGTKIAFLQEVA